MNQFFADNFEIILGLATAVIATILAYRIEDSNKIRFILLSLTKNISICALTMNFQIYALLTDNKYTYLIPSTAATTLGIVILLFCISFISKIKPLWKILSSITIIIICCAIIFISNPNSILENILSSTKP